MHIKGVKDKQIHFIAPKTNANSISEPMSENKAASDIDTLLLSLGRFMSLITIVPSSFTSQKCASLDESRPAMAIDDEPMMLLHLLYSFWFFGVSLYLFLQFLV
jgi:hypothetical protein